MLPKGWRRATLGEIGQIKSGSTPPRASHERYFVGGTWPWVKTMDLTNSEIKLTHEQITDAALKETSCKLFQPGTVLVAMYGGLKQIGRSGLLTQTSAVNQAISAIELDGQKAMPHFVLHWLNGHVATWKSFAASSRKDPNITRENVCNFPISLPPLWEQVRIAELLSTWDQAITATEHLLSNSCKKKQALILQLLTGQKRLTRFRSATEKRHTPHGSIPADWEYPRIEVFAKEVATKRGSGSAYPVLSCTKHAGLVDSLTYFNKQVFSADTSTYKVAPRKCFVYATNHIEEGSIGYQDLYDFGLVSPMYTVFLTRDTVLDAYLYRLLKTEKYRQIFAAATNSSVDRRGSLRWKEFKKLHVPLPSLEEQQAISGLIDTMDREIEFLDRQLASLRAEKIALMQQLLTGKRRVRLPESASETAA